MSRQDLNYWNTHNKPKVKPSQIIVAGEGKKMRE